MKTTVSSIEPLETRIAPAAVAAISLGSLDGKTGFKLSGVAALSETGFSVSAAGDVNGDGYGDFLVGAPLANGGGTGRGETYVVFGKAGGFPAGLSLAALDGKNGFTITGADHEGAGNPKAAGDVNGDGFDDIIIGAPAATGGGLESGAAYVVFGKAGGFGASLALSSLDGRNGFRLPGIVSGDFAGTFVNAAGDVNGDGLGDIIVGADLADEGGTDRGAAYVVFGKAGGFGASIALSSLDGSNGFKLSGVANNDHAGYCVSAAGDVNGDGIGDVIVGTSLANGGGTARGAAYVVYGKAGGFPTGIISLATLDGSNGFTITGAADGDSAGRSVSAAGDVNGDGIADIIVGAPETSEGGSRRGAAYVVFGHAGGFGASLVLSSLNGTNGFKFFGVGDLNVAGRSVSAAGDVNGDGFGDIIVGAFGADEGGTHRGAAYVVFGKAGGFGASTAFSSLDGTNGFKLSGVADKDYAGFSVSTAGDVNGDGFADVIVGATGAGSGFLTGTAYVVFGSSPIALSKDLKTATFTDRDGDIATLKVSKGALSRHDFTLNADGSLKTLDLTDASFAGTDVTLSAKKAKNGSGDGLVDVDKIDAHGIDLGKVSVSGRLEQLFAGDSDVKTAGVKSLTVGTLGRTPGGPLVAADYHSKILGAVGALTVKGDVHAADFEVTGGALAGIGKITIAGSLDPGLFTTGRAGFIHASGDIGPVSIVNEVTGGADFSGIAAGGKLGKVSIGGFLSSPDATKPVTISALGKLGATTAKDAVAIAGLSVKRNVFHALILAGYTDHRTPLNPDAGIGAISVSGNWDGSSVATGVHDTSTAGDLTSAPDGFGQHDTLIGGDTTPTLFATIASITIKGLAMGTGTAGDFFGITAQKIGKLSINGTPVVLTGTDTSLDTMHNDFHLVTV